MVNPDISRRSVLAFTATAVLSGQTGERRMSKSIADVCARYANAWQRKDLDAIAALIHSEIHFKSPTAETEGRDTYVSATARFLPLIERVAVRAQFISGDRAMFAYDFVCRDPIGVCPTAELVRVENDLIRESEVFFDARPFEALARGQAARKSAK
jgi:hypothetical protein